MRGDCPAITTDPVRQDGRGEKSHRNSPGKAGLPQALWRDLEINDEATGVVRARLEAAHKARRADRATYDTV